MLTGDPVKDAIVLGLLVLCALIVLVARVSSERAFRKTRVIDQECALEMLKLRIEIEKQIAAEKDRRAARDERT